jgi:hypothetical protein
VQRLWYQETVEQGQVYQLQRKQTAASAKA